MQHTITVIGGSGFVGRYVVQALARAGHRVQVICRDIVAAEFLKSYGEVGQIALRYGDITKPDTFEGALEGSYAVINLVGILHQQGTQRFGSIHMHGAKLLAEHAKKEGVTRFIHCSALGVDHALSSSYAKSKMNGERAVMQAFAQATILRPSLIIGAEDNFFQRFARMALISPVLPLLMGGKTRFQPVYVGDVVKAVMHCLNHPETAGKTYELGGPEIYSFKALLQMLKEITKRKFCFLPLPYWFAWVKAFFFELLPITPPFTRDQLRLLKHDNITAGDAAGFRELNITPTSIRAVLPKLLARYVKQ